MTTTWTEVNSGKGLMGLNGPNLSAYCSKSWNSDKVSVTLRVFGVDMKLLEEWDSPEEAREAVDETLEHLRQHTLNLPRLVTWERKQKCLK